MEAVLEKTISEYSTLIIEGYDLSDEERECLTRLSFIESDNSRKQRFFFSELKAGLKIETLSWVGVIELSGVRIIVKPKFNNGFKSLIDMICFVEKIPFYKWSDTMAEIGYGDFIELLMRLYIKELDKLIQKGFVKDYIMEEDNLRQMRGRPDFIKNYQKNFANPTRIFCRYDELVTNVLENQVILSALEAARKFRLLSSTRKRLNQIRSEFEKICNAYTGEVWPKFNYNRLNSHYEFVHKLTYYILKKTSILDIYKFKHESFFSILIDMNELFERFACVMLDKYLPKQYSVKHGRRITDAIQMDGKRYRDIIPDILVTDNSTDCITVIDTKYKNYGKDAVGTEDIFQLSFYAQHFHRNASEPCCSVIIYPRYFDQDSRGDISIDLLSKTIHKGFINVKDLFVEEVLELSVSGNKAVLEEMCLSLIRRDI